MPVVMEMSIISRTLSFLGFILFHLQQVATVDMECPDTNLRPGPSSTEAPIRVFISIVNDFNPQPETRPLCLLEVTTTLHSTLYQTMRLAERQHPRIFNFTVYQDLFEGFVVNTINHIADRQKVASWMLVNGRSGKVVKDGLDEIQMSHGDSYVWRYLDYASVYAEAPYDGECLSARSTPPSARVRYAIFYLSVQFWPGVWPLCKAPVVILDENQHTLNDVMLEAKRQHSSSFTFQVYTNNEIYAINELSDPSSEIFSWEARKAGSSDILARALYRNPLQDGDHVVWRYVDADGNPRVRPTTTVPPTLDSEPDHIPPKNGFARSDGSAYRSRLFLVALHVCLCYIFKQLL